MKNLMALLFNCPKFPKTKVIKCDDKFPGGVNIPRDEFDGTGEEAETSLRLKKKWPLIKFACCKLQMEN